MRNAGPFPAGILAIITIIIFFRLVAGKGPIFFGFIYEKIRPFSCRYFSRYMYNYFCRLAAGKGPIFFGHIHEKRGPFPAGILAIICIIIFSSQQ